MRNTLQHNAVQSFFSQEAIKVATVAECHVS